MTEIGSTGFIVSRLETGSFFGGVDLVRRGGHCTSVVSLSDELHLTTLS